MNKTLPPQSADDIAALAAYSGAEITRVRAFVLSLTGSVSSSGVTLQAPFLRQLWLAGVAGNPFDWANDTLTYSYQGRRVKREVVRAAAELVVRQSSADVGRVAQRLVDGQISLREWESEIQNALRRLHGANVALARGGWQQMAPAHWEGAKEALEFHYPYLRGFAEDVASGKVPLQSPQLLNRAQQYVSAGRLTYENERLTLHKERGFTECRRVLAASHHCATCEEEAVKGWQPIEDALPLGDSECRTNCQCVEVFR